MTLGAPPTRRTAAWLAALLLAAAAARLSGLAEPLDRDTATYLVIGHELLAGRPLYSDLFDHKGPAPYVTFALAVLVAGYGPGAVLVVNVFFTGLGLSGLYLAGAAGPGGRGSGLLAALLWTLFSFDLDLEGNLPNTELCINALHALALALVLRSPRPRAWGAAGLLAGVASLYKPTALAVLPALWLGALVRTPAQPRGVARSLLLVGPVAIVWGATFAYFALSGRFTVFVQTLFFHNLGYAGSIADNLLEGLRLSRLWPAAMAGLHVWQVLTLAGLAVGLARRSRCWVPLAGYLVCAFVMVSAGRQYFNHYFQFWLPALTLGSAWAVAEIGAALAATLPRAGAALLAAATAVALPTHLAQIALDPDDMSRRKFGETAVVVRGVGRDLGGLLSRGETLYVWGSDPSIYFYSGRSPVSGLLWIEDLGSRSLKAQLDQRVNRDLRRRRPDAVVLDPVWQRPPLHPALGWILDNYEEVVAPARWGRFRLLLRCDSPALRRLRSPPETPGPAV